MRLITSIVVVVAMSGVALADGWRSGFHSPGFDNAVYATAVYQDDLYVGVCSMGTAIRRRRGSRAGTARSGPTWATNSRVLTASTQCWCTRAA